MQGLQPEVFSSIVGDIYDCALNPAGWTGALTRVSAAMNAAYTSISLSNPQFAQARMASHSPWDPVMLKVLNDEYGLDGIPGLNSVLMGSVDEPRSTLNDMSEDVFYATPFYKNWVEPQGLRDGCVMKFAHTPDRVGAIASVTFNTRDIITADERRFMALLSPHLRRAALIGDLLDHQRVQTELFRESLERLSAPVLLVDQISKILYANSAAQRLLDSGKLVKLVGGCLSMADERMRPALIDAVARTEGRALALGSRGIGIPVTAAGQPKAVAYVLPLNHSDIRSAFAPAVAAVFIATEQAGAPPTQDVLATLYDLTPAEARLMVMMGDGVSTAHAAQRLNVTENTIKTHLARVYSKTGVARQSELVKLVSALAPPVDLL